MKKRLISMFIAFSMVAVAASPVFGDSTVDTIKNVVTTQALTDPSSEEDFIEYCKIITADKILEFYTTYGPYYKIDYANKRILACTSTGAIIKSCKKNGGVLTLVLYSDELPQDRTYTFELTDGEYRAGSVNPENCNDPDVVKHYKVFPNASQLEFDTSNGPYYCIDYKNKRIISCTSEGAAMKQCGVVGKILTVVLYSDERPADTTYVFDLTKFNYSDESPSSSNETQDGGEDVVEYYRVNSSKSVIEFDTSRGPYYQIDYLNKKILDCTSEGAVIKKLVIKGNNLSITLFSDERPQNSTYIFELPASPSVTPKPTDISTLPSTKEQETAILGQKDENDPTGATFHILQARQDKVTSKTITLTWKTVKGASSYTIYAAKTGKQNSFKKIKTTKKNIVIHQKLKKATYYKYIVVANGNGKALATSPVLFIATTGWKTGNPTGISLKKSSVEIKIKKSAKIEAGIKKGRLEVKEFRPLCYESNNTDVATVDKTGKIKAVSKGTCYICVYAQNGMVKKLKVTVR